MRAAVKAGVTDSSEQSVRRLFVQALLRWLLHQSSSQNSTIWDTQKSDVTCQTIVWQILTYAGFLTKTAGCRWYPFYVSRTYTWNRKEPNCQIWPPYLLLTVKPAIHHWMVGTERWSRGLPLELSGPATRIPRQAPVSVTSSALHRTGKRGKCGVTLRL